MLSIVKMDFDSDVEILDEDLIKSETIDIEETTIGDDEDTLNNALNDLELVPIVYTTKLDDMGVLQLDPVTILPDEASVRIQKESKPVLRTYPGPPRKGRKNTKRFGTLKAYLEKIYCLTKTAIKNEQIDDRVIIKEEIDEEVNRNEQIDDPDICAIKIDLNSVKSEVFNEPVVEEPKPQDTCKYSELLKLCKPCSVVLIGPVLIGSDKSNQIVHGGKVLKASIVQKPRSISSSRSRSSEDDVPLITLYSPDLLVERKSITVTKAAPSDPITKSKSITDTKSAPPDLLVERKSIAVTKMGVKQYKVLKLAKPGKIYNISPKSNEVEYIGPGINKTLSRTSRSLMRNGLLEIQDIFSNEYHFYYADSQCNLIDYFKDTGDKARIYQNIYLHVDCRYKIENCCWAKKDECIQSLYPRMLTYPNSRFMRKPHPCKPGACACCCRNKDNVLKPDTVFSEERLLPSGSNNRKSLEKDDIEILDVEDKIHKTIISINKSPLVNPNEKLSNSFIGKALAYKGPLPAKKGDNRHLVTLKKTPCQNTVIILRNYADDVIEIYEKDTEGDIVSYLKTTCYGNTNQSDILKLLNKPNSACEAVCCWFKREYIINKLQNSITLKPRAANFIRTNHTCDSKECTCCCMPINEEIELDCINLPSRSQYWKSRLRAWGLVSGSEFQKRHPPQPVLSIPFQSTSQSASSGSLGKDNDDDCQITAVMTSPIFQPLAQKSTVPPSIFVPEAVDGDELSKEVNTLITSILDRFKDVRLTINNDGKVAAALNTPVNTLSTVELKVLANILSYAQSQIDLLGSKVNSGMSLSNIINLKVDDVQSNRAPIDPNSIYKEFGKNVNLNTNVHNQPVQFISANNTPMAFPQAATVPQTYTFFTNSSYVKNQHFNDAFSSYINSKMDTNPETITPVIENVYSLKDSETAQTTEGTDEDSSFTTVWYRKPAQSSASRSEESVKPNTSKKRNDDSMTEAVQSKKIRVLSPAKLGAATDKLEGTVTTISTPNLPTTPENGPPRIIILPNNDLNVQSLGQPHTQGMVNSMSPATVSHPILIINPLQDTGGLLSPSIGNNTPNMAGISHSQSKIPVVSASTSHMIDTGSNDATPQFAQNMDADVMETAEQDPFTDNDPDLTADPEMGSDLETGSDPEMDNYPNMDHFENDDSEMKYSPENNEEEEDCILGF